MLQTVFPCFILFCDRGIGLYVGLSYLISLHCLPYRFTISYWGCWRWIDGPTSTDLRPSSADRSPRSFCVPVDGPDYAAWVEEFLNTAAGSRFPRTYVPTDWSQDGPIRKDSFFFVLDFWREFKEMMDCFWRKMLVLSVLLTLFVVVLRIWMALSDTFYDSFRVNFLILGSFLLLAFNPGH